MNFYKNDALNNFLEQKLIDKLLFILFITIPYFYISGPFLSDTVLIIITFLYLVKISKFDNKKNIILISCIFLITAYFFFNHLLLNNFDKNYFKSLFYFRFLIIVPVAFLIFKTIKAARIFFYAVLFASLFVILDIFFQKIFGFDLFGIDALESFNKGMHVIKYQENLSNVTRFSGPFGDELIAGGYISKFFLINLIFINYELKTIKYKFFQRNKDILILSFIFITLLSILITGERSALIYAIISLFLYIAFFNLNFKSLVSGFFILIIIISTSLSNSNFKKRFYDSSLDELFSIEIDNGTFQKDIEIEKLLQNKHISHYNSALAIFKENIIFGGGFKKYRYICDSKEYECSTHPHNIFLEILSSVGVLGFFLFYIFFIIYFKLYLKNKFRNNLIYFLFVLLNFLFILPTGSIFNNYFCILSFYVLAAFMVSLENLDKDKKYYKN